MKDIFHARLKLFHIVVIFIALIFVGKLFFAQIIYGKKFREEALGQYVTQVSDVFDRGSIFFKKKDGEFLGAATVKSGFLLAVNPRVLQNAEHAYKMLAEIIPNINKESFLEKTSKRNDPYEEIAHHLDKDTASEVRALAIPGVNVYQEKWRFYPGGMLAAQVLGFVGFKGKNFGGRYGVERYYEDTLQRNEKDLYINFFAEVFANIEHSLFYRGSREGDVVLGIEPEVQHFLEETLTGAVEKWSADSGGAIIMNPRDGTLYGMAAFPTFNPNNFRNTKDYTIFSNPLVERVFEMGSIIKPLTVAAGLDAGAIKIEDVYTDRGFVNIDDARIENYDGKARGVVSMQEILNQSLNTGAVYIMQEMGTGVFARYFLELGLGEETGVDLPNEIPGLVSNLQSPREIEYATASFGQGIAMTPIATVRALGALANKGVLVTPHVADTIRYTLGSSKDIFYGGEKRVFKDETSEKITRMLVNVVDKALLNGKVMLPRYSIAAKTGTAQIADKENGGYYEDRFLHAFFGYFPAYDPQFIIFFYLVEPKEVRYASQTLTYPFMDVVNFLINYYEIAPDR